MRAKPSAFEVLPWVPTFFGVAIMIGVLVFASVLSLGQSPSNQADPVDPGPPPTLFAPSLPAGTDIGAATALETPLASPSTATPTPSRPPRTTRPATPAPAPPPAPDLTGRYWILDSFGDSFIGEVLVVNRSGGARNWTVRLTFPANVGNLRTFWIEGAPQGGLRRSGAAYIFTSGVPVPARSSVPLRFHYDRTGSVDTPSACSVNGATCTGF